MNNGASQLVRTSKVLIADILNNFVKPRFGFEFSTKFQMQNANEKESLSTFHVARIRANLFSGNETKKIEIRKRISFTISTVHF